MSESITTGDRVEFDEPDNGKMNGVVVGIIRGGESFDVVAGCTMYGVPKENLR